MRGRPTLIKNLVPGMICRIRVIPMLDLRRFRHGGLWYSAFDDSGSIPLSGRTHGVDDGLVLGARRWLYGRMSRRGNFFVEEIEK